MMVSLMAYHKILDKMKFETFGRDYYFTTDNYSYKVSVIKNAYNPKYPYIGFKAKAIDDIDFNYDMGIITNDNLYLVMKSIKEILIHDQQKYKSSYTFSFTGNKKKSTQRLNLYKRCLSDWNINYNEDSNQYLLER
jgi:hypothetical protein